MIPKSHPLATVKGVNNALLIEADPLGEIMLYGPGAGSGPTAASVVSDILNLHAASVKNNNSIDPLLSFYFWRNSHIIEPSKINKKITLGLFVLIAQVS